MEPRRRALSSSDSRVLGRCRDLCHNPRPSTTKKRACHDYRAIGRSACGERSGSVSTHPGMLQFLNPRFRGMDYVFTVRTVPGSGGVLRGAEPPHRLVSTPSKGPPLARLGVPCGSPNPPGFHWPSAIGLPLYFNGRCWRTRISYSVRVCHHSRPFFGW